MKLQGAHCLKVVNFPVKSKISSLYNILIGCLHPVYFTYDKIKPFLEGTQRHIQAKFTCQYIGKMETINHPGALFESSKFVWQVHR